MQPEILSTFAEIGLLPSTVRKIYQKHDVKIRQGSDLEKCLTLCDTLSDNVDLLSTDALVRLNKAKRLLDAIIACSNEEELKEPLKRISENSIITNNTTHSMGKDALFELELLQYIKHRRLEAKLGEPDIVVASPYGEYYIACKTINSLNNFEKQLRSGYHQIEKYGKGCIAINLEPHLCLTEPLACLHPMFAGKIVSNYTQGIIKKLKPVINKGLRAGRFDGVVFMITCVIKTRPGHGNLDSFTQAYFLSDYQNQPLDNYYRFNEFQNSMRGPLSEHVN